MAAHLVVAKYYINETYRMYSRILNTALKIPNFNGTDQVLLEPPLTDIHLKPQGGPKARTLTRACSCNHFVLLLLRILKKIKLIVCEPF